jgi:hypothetical protein
MIGEKGMKSFLKKNRVKIYSQKGEPIFGWYN